MNAEERQALREKHQKKYYFPPTCEKCDIEKNDYEENLANGDLIGCGFTESEEHVFGEEWWACAEDGCESWPCDVIKVLDATEFVKECNHIEGVEIPEWKQNVWLWFTFCPKCGEKL